MFPQADQPPKPRADIKDSLRVQIDPSKLAKKDAEYLVRELTKLHPELAQGNMPSKKQKKSKGRHCKPPLVSHHNHSISDSEAADESNDSSAEGGDNYDDGEDNDDDDDDDDDDDSSDEEVVLSNFNLLSSGMYVVLMNMGIKKISADELCLIGLRAKATKNKCNYDIDRFSRINRFRRTKLSVSIE